MIISEVPVGDSARTSRRHRVRRRKISASGISSATLFTLVVSLPVTPAAAKAGAVLDTPAIEDSAVFADAKPMIQVTGTRIKDPELAGIEPITSIDLSRILERNAIHFADTLNETPGYRGSVTPTGAQASHGQGVNFINAFGLGSNRTLTLIDGQRLVSSNGPSLFNAAAPGSQVDLNAIPAILIKSVERISVGGAPVYGSDAIAGTVNVLLDRRKNGLMVQAVSDITEQGDGHRWKIAGAGGQDFADGRGNITMGLSFDRTQGVKAADRSYYRTNIGSAPNPCTTFQPGVCSPFGTVAFLGPPGRTPANDGRINPNIGFNDSLTDGNPGSVLVRDFSLAAISPGGVISSGLGAYSLRFAPDGSLVPYDRGTLYGAPLFGPFAPAALASGGDGLKLFDYVSLLSQLKRMNAAVFVTYELDDSLTVFADGLYYQGKSSEPIDLPSFNAVLFQGASGALTFRTDNPFLTDQARQQLAQFGYGETFQLSRANTDLVDLSGSSKNELFRIVTGLDGEMTLAGRKYDFDVSVNFGRSDFTDRGETIDQQRFVNAVNVALVDGRPACSLTPTVGGLPAGLAPVADPSCVPLNLFGTGAPSAEALDYILQDTVSKSRLEQVVFNANLGGSPFDVFGNPVAFNIGFEHRQEKARFTPDAFLAAGFGRTLASPPVSGRYNLDELFGEVMVPLISPQNQSAFHKLVAFARVRQVDNSRNGGFTAWSAGGSFAPVEDVEFRGNFTRSFRSPAILELFSPRTSITTFVPDLCSAANINAGPVPDIRSANCAAFLASYPNATPLIAATASIPGLAGGNPDLRNERADSYTFGAVVRPRFISGLSVSVDYLDVRIDNPISSLSIGQIAQGCFDNPDFDSSDPANGNSFCSLIPRDSNGQVIADPQSPAVVTGFVNGKQIRMNGVETSLNYRTDLDAIGLKGVLQVGGDLFYLRRRVVDITGVAPARSDGIVGDPKWQGQLRVRYANARWGVRTHVNYTGKQLLSRTDRGASPNDAREIDHFKAFATVDTSLFIEAGNDMRFTFSVTNLFNRIGEKYNGYIVPLSINDALGRRFAVSLRKEF